MKNNNNKTNILFVSAWGAADSGVFRFQYKWLRELSRRPEVNLYWYYPLKSGCPENDAKMKAIGVICLSGNHEKHYCREVCDDINRILDQEAIDIVHIHTGHIEFQYMLATNCFCNRGGLKVICHSHGSGDMNETIMRKIRRFGGYILQYKKGYSKLILPFRNKMRKVIKQTATICAACGQVAGEWLYGKGIEEDPKWRVVTNTIDTQAYIYNQEKRNRIREKTGLSDDQLVIGNVGAFQRIKNHVFLIDVLNGLIDAGLNVRLLIAGDGYMRNAIENKTERAGLSDRVIMYGRVPSSAEVLSAMDIFLMPSISEGFSIAAIEAQSSGLPCVFSSGCPREMQILGDCRFCDLESADSWVESIMEFVNKRDKYNDPESIADRRIAKNQEVRDRGFDDVYIVEHVAAIYDELIGS